MNYFGFLLQFEIRLFSIFLFLLELNYFRFSFKNKNKKIVSIAWRLHWEPIRESSREIDYFLSFCSRLKIWFENHDSLLHLFVWLLWFESCRLLHCIAWPLWPHILSRSEKLHLCEVFTSARASGLLLGYIRTYVFVRFSSPHGHREMYSPELNSVHMSL